MVNDEEVVKINMLEIDLGTVEINEFTSEEVVMNFRKALEEAIEKNRYQEKDRYSVSAVGESYIDILQQFLLYGDIPWWINKNKAGAIAQLFEKAMLYTREELRQFLQSQAHNNQVSKRIKTNVSASVLSRLQHPLPQMKPNSLAALLPEPGEVRHVLLSPTDLPWIKLFLQHRLQLNSEPVRVRIREISSLLQKLTVYHLGLFLQKTEGSESMESATNEVSGAFFPDKEKIHKKVRKIEQLVWDSQKPTGYDALLLHQRLLHLPEKQLQRIYELLHQMRREGRTKKIIAQLLANHPHFLKYTLPVLLSGITLNPKADNRSLAEKERKAIDAAIKKIEKASAAIEKSLRKLSQKKAAILSKVFASATYPSAPARKVMMEWLEHLPQASLLLFSSIASLEPQEIERLVEQKNVTVKYQVLSGRIIIENAGLCLVAPFLPHFFRQLNFTKDGHFVSKAYAHRAMYLLQYIVNKRQRNFEYAMQLNKLLCGLEIDEPIAGYKRLTREERKEADDLIASAIEHWQTLRSTSIDGFRRSFLQRKGILTKNENYWVLRVEKNAYDLLLDSIPWAFNQIKLPWMQEIIQVEW